MLRTSSTGAFDALVRLRSGALALGLSLIAVACTDQPHVDLEPAPFGQARLERDSAPVEPSVAVLSEASLAFSMNKWLDESGASKASVAGRFARFEVSVDGALAGARGIEELADFGARVSVDLGSVETDLPLRDDNIERAYFEASSFPSAVFRVTNARPQGRGESGTVLVDGELDLHGFTVDLTDIALTFTRVDGGWRVASVGPIAIRSADFGMPVRALLQTCGHLGIDDAAALTVAFTVLDPQ